MKFSILKNLSVSAILLLTIGCEKEQPYEPVDDLHGTVYVTVEYVDEIVLNTNSWQTLKTIWGILESDMDVSYVRVEWSSNMFWVIGDTTGYFKTDCRTCNTGTWYDTDGTTEYMSYDFNSMSPVTNQISIADNLGQFGNVLAPVRSMKGDVMTLWWNIGTSYIDSMEVALN